MGSEITTLGIIFIVVPYTEGLLFVDVRLTHGDSDGENGNVHHDKIRYLYGGMELSNIHHCKSSRSRSGGLEETVKESESGREGSNSGVFQLDCEIND